MFTLGFIVLLFLHCGFWCLGLRILVGCCGLVVDGVVITELFGVCLVVRTWVLYY